MKQDLKSKYNKLAKRASSIIGIKRKKEAVCKCNLMRREKPNYTKLLREISAINNEDEYSLHHEYSFLPKARKLKRNSGKKTPWKGYKVV